MQLTRNVGDWRSHAACLSTDPELFFPISSLGPARVQVRRAKEVCARCPVRQQCLGYALAHGPVQGVWGGTTDDERLSMLRREPAGVR
jgi:WhiB family transcriptional regulator, redox-sensing transcriptional regulator